jgi:hypothetical protein
MTSRRGFLASLAALVAAPHAPVPNKPLTRTAIWTIDGREIARGPVPGYGKSGSVIPNWRIVGHGLMAPWDDHA